MADSERQRYIMIEEEELPYPPGSRRCPGRDARLRAFFRTWGQRRVQKKPPSGWRRAVRVALWVGAALLALFLLFSPVAAAGQQVPAGSIDNRLLDTLLRLQEARATIQAVQGLICAPVSDFVVQELYAHQSMVEGALDMFGDGPLAPVVGAKNALDNVPDHLLFMAAFSEQQRLESAAQFLGTSDLPIEDRPDDDPQTLLSAIGIDKPYRFGSLFLEYQGLVAMADSGDASASQLRRLQVLLPLIATMLDGILNPPDESAQASKQPR